MKQKNLDSYCSFRMFDKSQSTYIVSFWSKRSRFILAIAYYNKQTKHVRGRIWEV